MRLFLNLATASLSCDVVERRSIRAPPSVKPASKKHLRARKMSTSISCGEQLKLLQRSSRSIQPASEEEPPSDSSARNLRSVATTAATRGRADRGRDCTPLTASPTGKPTASSGRFAVAPYIAKVGAVRWHAESSSPGTQLKRDSVSFGRDRYGLGSRQRGAMASSGRRRSAMRPKTFASSFYSSVMSRAIAQRPFQSRVDTANIRHGRRLRGDALPPLDYQMRKLPLTWSMPRM